MTQARRKVEVEWEDSVLVSGGWINLEEAMTHNHELNCLSVGYVLKDNKEGLIMASGLHDENASGVTVIPKSAIRKKTYLP